MLKLTRTIALAVFLVFIVLYTLIWLFSPPVTRLVLNKVLQSEKVVLSDASHVRLNLFLSRLTVEQLSLVRQDQTTLHIQEMQVKYSLLKLLKQEVHIEKVMLDGLKVEVDVDGDDAHAAGFLLNRPATETDTESTTQPETQGGRKVAVAVPQISLKNIQLNIIKGEQSHELVFDSIEVERTLFHQSVLDSHAKISGRIDGAPFRIETSVNYGASAATAAVNFKIESLALARYHYLLPENIAIFTGDFDLELSVDLVREQRALAVRNIQTTAVLREFKYADQQYRAELAELNVALSEAEFSQAEEAPLRFKGLLQLSSSDIASSLADANDQLAGLATLKVNDLAVALEDEAVELSVTQIDVAKLWFSKPQDTNLPPVAVINEIIIENLTASNDAAKIERIAVNGGESAVIINSEGRITNLVATSPASAPLQEEPAAPAADAPTATPDTANPFMFELVKFEVTDSVKVTVQDNSVKPKFDETFYVATAELESLSNAAPENLSHYKLAVNDGEFFKLDLNGKITPFAEALDGEFTLSTREFALHEVSPYVSNTLGFNILAGQLDLDFKGSIQANQLKSIANSNLRGAEFKSDKNYDENDMLGQTAIPLNVALGMLKDGDGNIKLKIPVNGDIRSPDFSVRHIVGLVVRKAAMSQAKSYLIKTFVPYGQVLSVAMAAGSYALKVRFEDLPYTATQVEPAEPQSTFANQLATLMQDKSDLQIKVCPIVTPADTAQTTGKTVLSDEEKTLLLDFGEQRAAAFKRFMVENKTVASSRLLLCAPEIEMKENSQPRIKFSI